MGWGRCGARGARSDAPDARRRFDFSDVMSVYSVYRRHLLDALPGAPPAGPRPTDPGGAHALPWRLLAGGGSRPRNFLNVLDQFRDLLLDRRIISGR